MTGFLDDVDPTSLVNIVKRQGEELAALKQMFLSFSKVDEVADGLGDSIQFRAIDANGVLRMIMSAINLKDELGISAYLAGLNSNAKPQFWMDADNGAGTLAGGNITVDSRGMHSNTRMVIVESESGNGAYYFFLGGLLRDQQKLGLHFFSTNFQGGLGELWQDGQFINGLSSYTQVGTPTLVQDSANDVQGVEVDYSSGNYVKQSFTLVVGNWYLMRFYCKRQSAIPTVLVTGAVGSVNPQIDTDILGAWTKCVLLFQAASTNVEIWLMSNGVPGQTARFSDISLCWSFEHISIGVDINHPGQLFFDSTKGMNLNLNEIEIDFGSTAVYSATFLIFDPYTGVPAQIRPVQSGNAPTGKDADENEFDQLEMTAIKVNSAYFNLHVKAVPGPVSGKFKVYY